MRYSTVLCSPGVPGARPSNASDASVFTVADILAGLIGDCDAAMPDVARQAAPSNRARIRFKALLRSLCCLHFDPFAAILARTDYAKLQRAKNGPRPISSTGD